MTILRCHIISAIDHGRLVLRDEGEKGIQSVEALNVAATVLLSSGQYLFTTDRLIEVVGGEICSSSASRARLVVAAVALDIANHKVESPFGLRRYNMNAQMLLY